MSPWTCTQPPLSASVKWCRSVFSGKEGLEGALVCDYLLPVMVFHWLHAGWSNIATGAHHWSSQRVLRHKISRDKSADKNYLFSDLLEVVLQLIELIFFQLAFNTMMVVRDCRSLLKPTAPGQSFS